MAATSSSLHACMATSMQCLLPRGSRSSFLTSSHLPLRQRLPGRVRCQADGPVSPRTPPPPAPKVSTKFSDVLAFSGPAPERINGRLAMVGFVTALAVEAASGNDLVDQLASGSLPWFLYATGLLSVASLVPLFQGVTAESKSEGLMTSNAEMWNGRLAMLGLVALVITEYLKGGPLV